MSNWMNDALAPGDTIEVMRPAGLFVLRDADVPIVAFAGGSGITPVLSIIKTALATTARAIALVYANRSADSVIFADELERLRAGSGGRLSVHHHLDSERGFLDAAACAALVGDRAHADFYVCGPGPVHGRSSRPASRRRGVDPGQLFIERFEVPDEAPAASEASETESIVIRLDGRKHRVGYEPGDTILEAARRAGLSPPFSCEAGSCATCMAHLDEGTVTMRVNNALAADEVEEGWVLTCQAIPDEPRGRRRLRPLTGRLAAASELGTERSEERQGPLARLDARVAVGAEREDADRQVGDARVAEGAQPIDDGRLVPRREDVADVGGVAVLEQSLVVRARTRRARAPGSPTPRAASTSSLGQRATGTPATTRGAGLPAPAAAFVMRGTTCSRDGALVGHPQDRPRRVLAGDAQHHRAEGREQDRGRGEVRDVDRAVHAVPVVLDVDRARAARGPRSGPRGSCASGGPAARTAGRACPRRPSGATRRARA